MIPHHPAAKRFPIEEAWQQVQSVAPVSRLEFDQIVYELRGVSPSLSRQTLRQLIVDKVVAHWCTGLSCCD